MALDYDNKPAPGTHRARLIGGVAQAPVYGTAYVHTLRYPEGLLCATGMKATFVSDSGGVTIVGTE